MICQVKNQILVLVATESADSSRAQPTRLLLTTRLGTPRERVNRTELFPESVSVELSYSPRVSIERSYSG